MSIATIAPQPVTYQRERGHVSDIINDVVDSRAEAKVQELLKAQPAAQVAPATELKANQ